MLKREPFLQINLALQISQFWRANLARACRRCRCCCYNQSSKGNLICIFYCTHINQGGWDSPEPHLVFQVVFYDPKEKSTITIKYLAHLLKQPREAAAAAALIFLPHWAKLSEIIFFFSKLCNNFFDPCRKQTFFPSSFSFSTLTDDRYWIRQQCKWHFGGHLTMPPLRSMSSVTAPQNIDHLMDVISFKRRNI